MGGTGHRGVGGSAEGPPTGPIMASALTILLLNQYWRQPGAAGRLGRVGFRDPSLPKPSVSVRSSRGVTTRELVAISHPCDPALLVVRDNSRGNIVRLALGAGVLLALALILAEVAHGWRRGRP
ncbi:unnamed protein product [Natator depressus]